ncbi:MULTISPECIES: phospholipase D-like domain-containing protein [unclassified Sphingobium]|uniref:phospholipase D-like domain-containing protein n=1 Tax=unclassified Sphingobium TaxID=2611147 RepID=UPI000A776E1A|nr:MULTISPECIES: phospholipase D-like domain-containing protein [unclassified Sphingobium]
MSLVKIRDAYGNSKDSGYSIDFFRHAAMGAREAFLASPFVATYDPIRMLVEQGCRVNLLVRLCSITRPPVLREALKNPLVSVRYYSSRSFHAKLYIIDDIAMVGSANLTDAGLMSNQEVSVVLRKGRDASFDDLQARFRLFWEYADVFTTELCTRYEEAWKVIGNPKEEEGFEEHLKKFVPPAAPPSAKVGSEIVSKRRSFLQDLRRKYDQGLIPDFEEVRTVFSAVGRRRAEFAHGDIDIEIGRFLGWLRVAHAPGESWSASSLVDAPERRDRISHWLEAWFAEDDTDAGDMVRAENEVANITRLRTTLGTSESINTASYDEIFDALSGVHAFHERLRFVAGGLEGLRAEFLARNGLPAIRSNLDFLLHGPGTQLERAYDCLYNEARQLAGFGEACVMELVGWMDEERPPINGRTIKALRFLGFDVKD